MTTQPTDAQRAEWADALWTPGAPDPDDIIDAIFAAGVEAGQAGMTVEWGDPAVNGMRAGLFRRVTDWQATP